MSDGGWLRQSVAGQPEPPPLPKAAEPRAAEPTAGAVATVPVTDARDGRAAWAAAAIILGVILIVVAAGITGFTVKLGASRPDTWKTRVKVIGLTSPLAVGSTVSGGFVAGVCLLVALAVARLGRHRRSALVGAVGAGACAVALWLTVITAAGIYVDADAINEARGGTGLLVAATLGDVAALVVLLVAVGWGAAAALTRR